MLSWPGVLGCTGVATASKATVFLLESKAPLESASERRDTGFKNVEDQRVNQSVP